MVDVALGTVPLSVGIVDVEESDAAADVVAVAGSVRWLTVVVGCNAFHGPL